MFSPIGKSIPAGNAVNATIHTVTEGFAILGMVVAKDSGGGATLTISALRNDGTTRGLVVAAIGAGATVSFTNGATNAITPLILNLGESLVASATTANVVVTISGLTIT